MRHFSFVCVINLFEIIEDWGGTLLNKEFPELGIPEDIGSSVNHIFRKLKVEFYENKKKIENIAELELLISEYLKWVNKLSEIVVKKLGDRDEFKTNNKDYEDYWLFMQPDIHGQRGFEADCLHEYDTVMSVPDKLKSLVVNELESLVVLDNHTSSDMDSYYFPKIKSNHLHIVSKSLEIISKEYSNINRTKISGILSRLLLKSDGTPFSQARIMKSKDPGPTKEEMKAVRDFFIPSGILLTMKSKKIRQEGILVIN